MSITAALRDNARKAPEAIAVSFDEFDISWAGLDALVDRAAAFIAACVPDGAGVALLLPNSPAFIIAFLGAARAGREAQVFDPEWPEETTRKLIAHLNPGLLVSSEPCPVFSGRVLVMDHKTSFGEAGRLFPDCEAGMPEPHELSAFYTGFTSGSTGMPKGYRRHHKSWLRSFACDQQEFGLVDGDIILVLGSFTHSIALYALIKGLNSGVKVVVCRAFHIASAQRLLQRHSATILYGAPSQLALLADAAARAGIPHQTIRLILSGGAKWQNRQDIGTAFPAAEFIEFYGASELSFVTLAKQSEEPPPASVGRPMTGVTVTIRDQDGTPLPQGACGLVFVESDFHFLGYATGNDAALHRIDGAISVGDVGFFDENGYLHLAGRADRMINRAGKKIHPEEVEAALMAHPGIKSAAVFGIADASRGQTIVAAIHLDTVAHVTRVALIRHLRTTLPVSSIPKEIGVMFPWPMTPSGKTDFNTIAARWRASDFEPLP